MLAFDRGALICDLAETYNIYDYKRVPVRLLGTLVSGLRENSRIIMKMTGRKATVETIWLARIYDVICAVFSDEKHPHKPVSETLFDAEMYNPKPLHGFISGDEFLKAREKLIKKGRLKAL